MLLRLNRSFFRRKKTREEEFGAFFTKTSNRMVTIANFIVSVFFTPAMITTSLLSSASVFIFANVFLSLGYLTNFIYRACTNRISKSQTAITAISLALILAASTLFFMPFSLSVLGVVAFCSKLATVINAFFLVQHVLVPPCKKMIEKIAEKCGWDIKNNYYKVPELNLEDDRAVIDRLMRKSYGFDSFDERFKPEYLTAYNLLLNKLCEYVSKYNEIMFGSIRNKSAIAAMEQYIHQILVDGNADSATGFIRKKIDFRCTKIATLKDAKKQVTESPAFDFRFFKSNKTLDKKKINYSELKHQGKDILDAEITKQQDKIKDFYSCLPPSSP